MHRKKKNNRKSKKARGSEKAYEQARNELLKLTEANGSPDEEILDQRRFVIDQVSYVVAMRIDFCVVLWVESGLIRGQSVLDDWYFPEHREAERVFDLLHYTKNPVRVIRKAISVLAEIVCSQRRRIPYFFFSANGEKRQRVYRKHCKKIEEATGYGEMLVKYEGSRIYFLRDSPRGRKSEESEQEEREVTNLDILRAGNTELFCSPSHYPISKVVSEIARRFGASPSECVNALGLRNRKRAAKRINWWIAEGKGHLPVLKDFGEAAGEESLVEQALKDTNELRQMEREAAMWQRASEVAHRFEPTLFVVPEASRPKTIFAEAVTEGRHRLVPWESFPDEGISEARIRAGVACLQHYQAHDGECWNWGAIAKYCFAEAWNRHSFFSKEGELLDVVPEPCWMPQASLSIGGRDGAEKVIG